MGNSAANLALPETFSGPSTRDMGLPIKPCFSRISGSGVPPGTQLSGASAIAVFMTAWTVLCTTLIRPSPSMPD
jgi:hypothetical protein